MKKRLLKSRNILRFVVFLSAALLASGCRSTAVSTQGSSSLQDSADSSHSLGIYIGTFDPPHAGHVQTIAKAIKELNLSKALVIANPRTPHKPNATPYQNRLEMTQLAFAEVERAHVATGPISDDFDGMDQTKFWQHVSRQYPNYSYFLVLGDDGLEGVSRLPMPDNVRRNITFVVNPRNRSTTDIAAANVGVKVKILPATETKATSSTQVRDDICHRRKSPDIKQEVYEYIVEHGFYSSC